MQRIIAGGTGFIGQALAHDWLAAGIDVTIIGRDESKIKACFGDTVRALTWDDFKKNPTSFLSNCDCIINLTGAGIGDKRWRPARKKIILKSRIESSELIAKACAELKDKAPRYLNASAIGIYGLQESLEANLPAPFSEESQIKEPTDFLSEVGVAWEKATQAAPDVVNLRFGVVLDKSGGALVPLARPFHFFIGGKIGTGQQAFSWISLVDLIAAINFILSKPALKGAINLVAMQAVKQAELAQSIGRALHRPCWLPVPGFVLRVLYGQLADELLLRGQHVIPARLLAEGFQFKQPDLDSALTALYE